VGGGRFPKGGEKEQKWRLRNEKGPEIQGKLNTGDQKGKKDVKFRDGAW